MSRNGTIQFDFGAEIRYGKRRLVVRREGDSIHDELNPFSAYDRQGILTRATEQFKLDPPKLKAFEAALLAAAEKVDSGEVVTYRTYTSDELDDADLGEEFLVEGILARNHPLIVGAPSKAMKTSVVTELLIKLAMGGLFLNQFNVEHTAICGFMTGESGLAAVRSKARRMCHNDGLRLRDLGSRLVWSDQLPKFGSIRHMDAVRRWITDHELEVLVIDPAYLAMPGVSAANIAEQGELLRSMSDISQECGCTLGLIHHLRKPNTYNYDAPELADLAGAGYAEFAGQWILLGRRSKFDPNTGTHHLWLVVGGRAEHWGQWGLDIHEGQFPNKVWETSIIDCEELAESDAMRQEEKKEHKRLQARAAKVEVAQDKIARAFACTANPNTESAIRKAAGYRSNQDVFDEAFGGLIRAGKLEEATVKKRNGQDYEGFKYTP